MKLINLFYDSGIVGDYERIYFGCGCDLEILRIAIKNRKFRSSEMGRYGDEEDISFSNKVEVLIASVEDQSKLIDTVPLLSLAMSLFSVVISILCAVATKLQIAELSALTILAGIILVLFVSSKFFAYKRRTELLRALRILHCES